MRNKRSLPAKLAAAVSAAFLMLVLAPVVALAGSGEAAPDGRGGAIVVGDDSPKGSSPLEVVADAASPEEEDDVTVAIQGDDDIASGTWGTCPWEIDKDGVLTIHPGMGEDTDDEYPAPWHHLGSKVASVVCVEENGKKVVAPKSCAYLFLEIAAIQMDLSGLDTSSVEDMQAMFHNCASLASLDLSEWDTPSVEDMHHMFSGCSALTSLDLSGWDTSKVTYMHSTFRSCTSLSSLDLSGWDTSSVTGVDFIFQYCKSLTSLDLSG